MQVEITDTDATILIGVLATLSAYFLTEEDPDVLINVQQRFRKDLAKHGLISADTDGEIVAATDAMNRRLRQALGE